MANETLDPDYTDRVRAFIDISAGRVIEAVQDRGDIGESLDLFFFSAISLASINNRMPAGGLLDETNEELRLALDQQVVNSLIAAAMRVEMDPTELRLKNPPLGIRWENELRRLSSRIEPKTKKGRKQIGEDVILNLEMLLNGDLVFKKR